MDSRRAMMREARILARHLAGQPIPRHLAARYARGVRMLFGAEEASALLTAVRRRPALLPFLDAAAGFLRPDDALRRRLLLMTAVLEADPHFAGMFLPREQGRAGVLVDVALAGAGAAAKAIIGAPMILWLGRRR